MVVALADTTTEPLLPEALKPEPVHDVAWVELHVSVAEPPATMLTGDTESVATGVGTLSVAFSATVTVPTCFQRRFFHVVS